ncbi:MAG: LysM peptidoglycan-binding domain-containing protein [Oscillospiraceae bacterium]|nr:LysM peptidoglycan-binding domain-containing protein [Oscillospiraceae bacterium]
MFAGVPAQADAAPSAEPAAAPPLPADDTPFAQAVFASVETGSPPSRQGDDRVDAEPAFAGASSAADVIAARPEEEDAGLAACVGKPYTVRRGDSFQLIARRFKVTVRALVDANPGLEPGRLLVGDVLCIPVETGDAAGSASAEEHASASASASATRPAATQATAPAQPAAPENPASRRAATRVQVSEGQSIVDILVQGNVSLSAFQAVNPRLRPGQQRVGEWMRMPAPGTRGACGAGNAYRVAHSESLADLASRLGVSAGALLRANAHLLPSDFEAGQVICVPVQHR